jgi:hypothetical protein
MGIVLQDDTLTAEEAIRQGCGMDEGGDEKDGRQTAVAAQLEMSIMFF